MGKRNNVQYSIEEVFIAISQSEDHKKFTLDGVTYTLTSTTRSLYNKGTTCVECGLSAEKFVGTIAHNGSIKRGLVAVAKVKNQYVKFTRDHIIPRSKGGCNHSGNIQIMCEPCNVAKSNICDVKYMDCVDLNYIQSLISGANPFKTTMKKTMYGIFHNGSIQVSKFFKNCYPNQNMLVQPTQICI